MVTHEIVTPDVAFDILPEDNLTLILAKFNMELNRRQSIEEPDGPVILRGFDVYKNYTVLSVSNVCRLARDYGNCAGLRSAIALLRQPELIPKEWELDTARQYATIPFFAGTIATNHHGDDHIFCLKHNGRSWNLAWSYPMQFPIGASMDGLHLSMHRRA